MMISDFRSPHVVGEVKGMRMPFVRIMMFAHHLFPVAIVGEVRVGLRRRIVNFRQAEPVGLAHQSCIKTGSPNDEDFLIGHAGV